MGFSFSLKTKEQLLEEQRRRYAAQVRRVEGGVRTLEALYCQAAQRGEDKYQQGKALLAVGREREARAAFEDVRLQGVTAMNCMRVSFMLQEALVQLKVAKSVQTAARCFKELAAASGLDAGKLEGGLDALGDVAAMVRDMDREAAKKMARGTAAAEGAERPPVDAELRRMEERARREVAAENGGASVASAFAPAASVAQG